MPATLPASASLHPWNHGFSYELPDTPSTVLTQAQRGRFARDGYIIVPDIAPPGELARLVDALDELEAKVDAFLQGQENGRVNIAESGAITFTIHCAMHSAVARNFVTLPKLLGLCNDLVGPDVNLYWDQAVYKKPEKPRSFPWHQDTGYTFTDPQHYLTCWVSLNGATIDNGCPWVLPGVFRHGTLLHHWVDPIGWQCLDPSDGTTGGAIDDAIDDAVGGAVDGAVAAEVPAGAAVVFSSLTPHQTGPNLTDEPRKAYIVQYGPAGMRTVTGDWRSGAAPSGSEPCDNPGRQFAVLRDGRPA